MADKPHVSAELSRELSLFHITMMGLGMMIGAGVFLGTGKSIGYAGPGGVLLTFALNGLIDGLWMEGSLNPGLYSQAILPDLVIEASERLLGLPSGTLSNASITEEQ